MLGAASAATYQGQYYKLLDCSRKLCLGLSGAALTWDVVQGCVFAFPDCDTC